MMVGMEILKVTQTIGVAIGMYLAGILYCLAVGLVAVAMLLPIYLLLRLIIHGW